MMTHEEAIKLHCQKRIRERLNGRPVETRLIHRMKIALLTNNADCFLRRVYCDRITGVVAYGNIYVTALLDLETGLIKTVGCKL